MKGTAGSMTSLRFSVHKDTCPQMMPLIDPPANLVLRAFQERALLSGPPILQSCPCLQSGLRF